MPITLDSLKHFQSRLYRENSDRINGISFSNDGNVLVTSSNDNSVVVFDLLSGKKQRKVSHLFIFQIDIIDLGEFSQNWSS